MTHQHKEAGKKSKIHEENTLKDSLLEIAGYYNLKDIEEISYPHLMNNQLASHPQFAS